MAAPGAPLPRQMSYSTSKEKELPQMTPIRKRAWWILVISAIGAPVFAQPLQDIAAGGQLPELRWPDFSDYREHVRNFYQPANYTPQWSRDGRPTPQALAIVDLLKQADNL